jgi:hypothetical protein
MWARPLELRNAPLLRNAPATAFEFSVLRTALLLTLRLRLPLRAALPFARNDALEFTALFDGA